VWSCVQGEMRDLHGNEISVWPDAKYTHWSTEEVYEAIALRVIARRSGSRVTEDLLRFITADVFAEAEGLDVRVLMTRPCSCISASGCSGVENV